MHLAENISLGYGVLGGLMLGGSSVLLMVLIGKISGISGIVAGLVSRDTQDWDLAYTLGLLTAGLIYRKIFTTKVEVSTEINASSLTIAGILSGIGTRLSGGCTSGHGLCGLGRFSPRSFISVLLFMTTGILTAGMTRSMNWNRAIVARNQSDSFLTDSRLLRGISICALGIVLKQVTTFHDNPICPRTPLTAKFAAYFCGLLFGFGLIVSGMASSKKVIHFLNFRDSQGWDPTLAAVLGGGVLCTALAFPYLHRNHFQTIITQEDLGEVLKIGYAPSNLIIDTRLIVGSLLFGIGWGMSGICPGPGLVNLGAGRREGLIYVQSLLLGILIKEKLSL